MPLRDIKQVFDASAPMEMLRSIQWAEDGEIKDFHPGDPIPEELRSNPGGKLRLFWSSGYDPAFGLGSGSFVCTSTPSRRR